MKTYDLNVVSDPAWTAVARANRIPGTTPALIIRGTGTILILSRVGGHTRYGGNNSSRFHLVTFDGKVTGTKPHWGLHSVAWTLHHYGWRDPKIEPIDDEANGTARRLLHLLRECRERERNKR